ncbi:hypothetical protein CLOP_g2678 [Closterium sp. NIES-67]|nr:hypothetical protein CLOP_g2678 [Closterium sp. NIES-67]
MRQFYTARVSPARLHAALVELFADADLAYRLVDRPAMLFTTDIWTSVASQAFMVLTGHWITSDFQLRQVVMEFEQLHGSHTGLLIAETFERVLT